MNLKLFLGYIYLSLGLFVGAFGEQSLSNDITFYALLINANVFFVSNL